MEQEHCTTVAPAADPTEVTGRPDPVTEERGEKESGNIWFGVWREVCWARKEQGAPGTFWAPEKAW